MKTASLAKTFELTPADNNRLAGLCGQFNAHLKQIEGHLGVQINNRGNQFSISGESAEVKHAERLLRKLYAETAESTQILPDRVQMSLSQLSQSDNGIEPELSIRTKNATVRAQNSRQDHYLRNIMRNDINFGIGPAGTGKTYLAVASATESLASDRVDRIILVRPAVEAGERLGFLPGDIGQKVDPYLRPLYDALYEMLGFEKVGKLIERNIIELAPLAYMRGRTLNDSFIILDEAQNTTVEQMKMFLTRIGFGSKAVVTGDLTQTDLPRGNASGLRHTIEVLKGIDDISFTYFKPQDVVRHPLVQKIVEAYEAHNREEYDTE